jgi:hypothetical protein
MESNDSPTKIRNPQLQIALETGYGGDTWDL